jgi:ABC-2 type transport system permease protein
MSDRGVVYDLGYKPHEGPRLGRSAAVAATVRDGVRRVFGIRRKAKRKVLPWLLFSIALLPAVVFVGLTFLTNQIAAGEIIDTPFANAASYFDIASTTVLLFCALAGPELLVPDRMDGVLAVYSSRPMTVLDYLGARAGALAISVGAFLIIPQLLLYVGLAALEPGGFAGNLVGDWLELVRVIGTTVVYLLAFGAPALLIAVFAKRVAAATGVYLGVMFALTAASEGFAESGTRWAALFSLAEHPAVVRDAIFDRTSELVLTRQGFDWWWSLAIILGLAVVTMAVAVRRYRSLM